MNNNQYPNRRYIEIYQRARDQEMNLKLAKAAWQAEEKFSNSQKQTGIKAWIVLLLENLPTFNFQPLGTGLKKTEGV